MDFRFQEARGIGLAPNKALSSAFSAVCTDLISGKCREYVTEAKRRRTDNWLQEVGSILGMLLHFEPDHSGSCLTNVRRPGCDFTTYPSSPSATSLVARMALSRLLAGLTSGDLQFTGSNLEAYLTRVLTFRVIDPTMESGLLLLALAKQIIERIGRANQSSNSNNGGLSLSVLRWLVANCLYGVDRNPLAPLAVQTGFRLLAQEYGDDQLEMPNWLVADSLRDLPGRLPRSE